MASIPDVSALALTGQMIVERAGARGMTQHEYTAGNLLGVEVKAAT